MANLESLTVEQLKEKIKLYENQLSQLKNADNKHQQQPPIREKIKEMSDKVVDSNPYRY
jgi:hypothetical protein